MLIFQTIDIDKINKMFIGVTQLEDSLVERWIEKHGTLHDDGGLYGMIQERFFDVLVLTFVDDFTLDVQMKMRGQIFDEGNG